MKAIEPFDHLIHIQNMRDYACAQDLLKAVVKRSGADNESPYNPLVDILSNALQRYEDKVDDLTSVVRTDKGVPSYIGAIRMLMIHENLGVHDLPEIGNEHELARVLGGEVPITHSAIEKICIRFGLRHELFFET